MSIYCPLKTEYKSIIGAVREGDELSLSVNFNGDYCSLVVIDDSTNAMSRFNMQKNGAKFFIKLKLPVGLYYYYFDIGNNKMIGNIDFEGVIGENLPLFQLSIFSRDFTVPNSFLGKIIYQIFPDRFCRSSDEKILPNGKIFHNNINDTPIFSKNENGQVLNNDFFGGDFRGIINKLDYLSQLNVGVIYLNPIFKAYSNHRYDTCDFMEIDDLLGSKDDFIELIKKAKEKGIQIILDGVFNHTGSDSIYFDIDNKYGTGAYNNKDSKYRKWFLIDENNNYDSWWGIKTLPATNKNCAEYVDFICGENGVIDYYTKLGIGGWRLDVVDELPQCFVEKIRERVKKINNDAIVIGEVWEDASNKVSYGVRRKYFLGKELDSVMNYPLKNAIIDYVKSCDCKSLIRVIREQTDHYPKQCLNVLMNILSTHDTFRLLSAVSNNDVSNLSKDEMSQIMLVGKEKEQSVVRLKIASLLQFTLYGVPSIYYGDEIGMEGYADPLNRKFFDWDNANFDILSWYKKLSKIRTSYDVFTDGELNILHAKKGIFAFTRENNDGGILVVVNIGNKPLNIKFDGEMVDLLSDTTYKNQFVANSTSFAVLIAK